GRPEAGQANTLLSLGRSSYLVVLQEAVVPGRDSARQGVVGLRVFLGDARPGLPAGTQILVGLVRAGAAAGPAGSPAEPWRVLGVASPPVPSGLPAVLEPFAGLPLPALPGSPI